MTAKRLKQYFLIILGSVSLALGFIGIFLPVLPTTPFLLLSSYCYLRSSESLYHWLMHHKIFGPYIDNYINNKSITRRTRNGMLVFLWCTLSISIFLAHNIYLKMFLVAVGIGVSIHLFTLKIQA